MAHPFVLPRPSTAAVRQTAAVLGALALCPVAALLIGDDPPGAVARGRALMRAQDALGIGIEPAVHAWTLSRPWLMTALGVFYVVAHVAVAGWALVWTWFLRRDRFAFVRDCFLWTQVGVLAIAVALPTAPPRLVPGSGYEDTLSWVWGGGAADAAHVLQSPYAAIPSGHVAFALVAGGTFARLGDQAWLRAFGWAYPPLVVAVTVMTGNHLLADAAAAVPVVVVAYVLGRLRGRRAATVRVSAGSRPRGRR